MTPHPPIGTESDLEDALSRPTEADVAWAAESAGDLVILGVSGKMGPSLARLALRAAQQAGVRRRVIGVARFTDPAARTTLERVGVHTVTADLIDPDTWAGLPDASNVVYMVGQKFGTRRDEPRTWVTNTWIAGLAARRYRAARLAVFSTGNVYPLTDVTARGAKETDPVGPIGEYAQSALGRERVFEFFSRRHGTPTAVLRLNYAVELRYGVLRDLADQLLAGTPIDLSMGYVNVIWQRDANAIALRALGKADSPPFVLNVTGPMTPVRALAERLAGALGVTPRFHNIEGETALVSDATLCTTLFGPPSVTLDEAIDWTADWVRQGGVGLGKPTHFQEREGRF